MDNVNVLKISITSSVILSVGLITIASIKEGVRYKEHKDAIEMMEKEKENKRKDEQNKRAMEMRAKIEAEKKALYDTFSTEQKFELEKMNKQKEIEIIKARSAEKIANEERLKEENLAATERRAKQDMIDAEIRMKKYDTDLERAKYGAISGGVANAIKVFSNDKNGINNDGE